MNRSVLAAMIAILCAVPVTASADSVLTFENKYGWEPRAESQSLSAEGLDVSISVATSPNLGMVYVKGEFCNASGTGWTGGMRVSNRYPSNAFATLRVPAGDCRTWGEHLPVGLTEIYVLVDVND